MIRLGVVALLLATGVTGCSSAGGEQAGDDEYAVLVEACDLVDPATVAELADGLAETVPRQPEPSRTQNDQLDSTVCRQEFGDSGSVPITPFDEFAPDTAGTPAYRYISVTASRFHAVDGQTGSELARYAIASDPQAQVPDVAALGLDDGDIKQRFNGMESFTRIRAIDENLVLLIEYGGANIGAKPPGIPAITGRDGALRLLADAAARRPCPTPDC
ncbi:hypothetical protein [Actinophytocola sp.]|uniref:hypothetical protein n=1 Tax=Actinophytocola sp. TaxID=1872138 RepID=UPI002ED12C54